MSNAMRLGKRTLAAAAAGAIGFAGLAFVAAPSAQAAGVVSVFSASVDGTGVAGNTGIAGDPSSVVADSSADSGDSSSPSRVNVVLSSFRGGARPISPLANQANYVILTVSGANATFACPTVATGNQAVAPSCNSTATQITVQPANWNAVTNANADDTPNALAQVLLREPGAVTVTVQFSWATPPTPPTTGNTWTEGTFTIQSLGAPGGAVFTPIYKSVSAYAEDTRSYQNVGDTTTWAADDSVAPLVLVQVSDPSGAILPITQGQVLVSGATAGSSVDTYVKFPVTSAACTNGVLNLNLNPGNWASSLNFRNVCSALNKGPGVIVASAQPLAFGPWSIQVVALTPGGTPVGQTTHDYTIASQRAASYTADLDSAAYLPGATAAVAFSVTDFGGRPVADGVWRTTWAIDAPQGGQGIRAATWQANAPIIILGASTVTPVSDGIVRLSTYNGATALNITVPERAMLFTMGFESYPAYPAALGQYAWASAGGELTRSVSAQIGEPEPVVKEIVIVGSRGLGDDANRVYVEGRTTNLVGETVTPYYRFPGETGFSAGTGVRTVDTDGNFAWQRKTGKKIAVQFRSGDVISNSIIIEAK